MKHQVSDEESDFEEPAKKKTKKTDKKGKGKAKGKTKQKSTAKKRRDNVEHLSDSEDEADVVPKRGRKPLVAKVAVWHDIPDWGDRTDCPLLDLPREIVDMCFSLKTGLDVSDTYASESMKLICTTTFR